MQPQPVVGGAIGKGSGPTGGRSAEMRSIDNVIIDFHRCCRRSD
jgi:hypothetical protein